MNEERPLPPPRCRGIPLGDGNYTGCAYGYVDITPLTGRAIAPYVRALAMKMYGELSFRTQNSAIRIAAVV